jgi:microcystin degradation protein MlrC
MRIAVGGFMHETNTFVDQPTAWEDFVRVGPWPTATSGGSMRKASRPRGGHRVAGARREPRGSGRLPVHENPA